MKSLVILFSIFMAHSAEAATTYFSCVVKEPVKVSSGGSRARAEVTVKFAIKNLDTFKLKGSLVQYPGSNADDGLIFVTPVQVGEHMTMMSNLNGQGGDLRLDRMDEVRLWGDGAGYQFTELVVWDVDGENVEHDGYVRDYGPTHGGKTGFKQFIKCKSSTSVL